MSFANQFRLLALMVTGIAAVFSIGCESNARQSDAVAIAGTDEPASSADEMWARLTSIEPDLVRLENESGLEHFMREVEMSNQARRSLGLEFWNAHPDDPRRYSWLIRTVYMAPAYPVELTEWARQETQLDVNVAARDNKAVTRWKATYPTLRDAFWTAETVTDQQRRLLWAGELHQEITDARRRHAAGKKVNVSALTNDIVDWLAAYPAAESELDGSGYRAQRRSLINGGVLDDPEAIGASRPEVQAFINRIRQTITDEAFVGRLDRRLSNMSFGEIESVSPARHNDIDAVSSIDLLSSLQETGAYWAHTHIETGTASADEFAISRYGRELGYRKYRDIGLPLAAEGLDSAKGEDFMKILSWMSLTHWSPPTYPSELVAALQLRNGNGLFGDARAVSEWRRDYSVLREKVWQHPEIEERNRLHIRANELWAELGHVRAAWKRTGDTSHGLRLMTEIATLLREYEAQITESDWEGHWLFASAPKMLGDSHADYGLTREDIKGFWSPFVDHPCEHVRHRARGALGRLALAEIPFEFSAPTMHGEDFDMQDLRGKIVLVDHWATTCSSCISAMPRLHEIYEDYKDRGFEVVSIAYDGEEQRKKVLRIEAELGLTWTTLNGEGQWDAIRSKYGYGGFPQYMLLDRDGTLYAGSGEVDMGRNLSALLDEMLMADERQSMLFPRN